ncbi:hypothetical protein MES5069_420048 [Mesorhizobium escarrei]|uniref:Alpha/beta hydrolase n=1 Tax=Mesorhizobium escarrei TaxID=666018 RepID=A0ABM9E5U4_9HYPH|nr:hypothetical protein MES5069_420048 [Mesorhizobium escarrei]
MPVMVVWGTDDAVLPFSQAEGLPAHFHLHHLLQAGHMLVEEAPRPDRRDRPPQHETPQQAASSKPRSRGGLIRAHQPAASGRTLQAAYRSRKRILLHFANGCVNSMLTKPARQHR